MANHLPKCSCAECAFQGRPFERMIMLAAPAHVWLAREGYWQQCDRCNIRRFQPPDAPDDGLVRDPKNDQPIPCHASGPTIHVGKMRLHFNRQGAAPLVWTVAAIGDAGAVLWELAVAGISCVAPFGSRYVPKTTPDDEDGKPSAWFEVDGALAIVDEGGFSCARITP